MSLKARLRLAVAVLMSAVVVVLSGLYMRRSLDAGLARANDVAESVASQLLATLVDELQAKAAIANPPPATPGEAKRFWYRTVRTDPEISSLLERSVRPWHLLQEIFVTDGDGTILASSMPGRAGLRAAAAPDLSDWSGQWLFKNIRQIYVDRQDSEFRRPIAMAGESEPVLNIHVAVSSVFLRSALEEGLEDVSEVCLACLLVSLLLALILPNFILSPLERLSHNIDLMTTGRLGVDPPTRGETQEFAAVYSKLNILGKQVAGAQEHVDQWRGNFEQLLERLEQAVLLFDATGRLTVAGQAAAPLLGREPSDLTGQTLDELFPPSTEIGTLVRNGERVRERVVNVRGRGQDHPVLVSIQPLERAKGGPGVGTLVTLRDAQTRGELAAQLDIASRLTALSQLTGGVAHEIKNPLNAIRLHLEMLRSRLAEDLPEVDVISREISRLDRVVKTFLDFNRPVKPQFRVLDMNEVVRDIAALIAPEARARKVLVDVRIESAPAWITGDLDLLNQAILNVVVNAIEAMKSGGKLMLEARRDGGLTQVIISDTGPGIPPEIRDKVFNLYFSTKERGSGIGLAMTFRLVQLQDGRIDVSSEAGRGTTFSFSFPEISFPTQAHLELSRSYRM